MSIGNFKTSWLLGLVKTPPAIYLMNTIFHVSWEGELYLACFPIIEVPNHWNINKWDFTVLRTPVWWKICLHQEVLGHPSIIHPWNQSMYVREHTRKHTHARAHTRTNVTHGKCWAITEMEHRRSSNSIAFLTLYFLCKNLGTQIKGIQIILLITTYPALCLNFSRSLSFKYVTEV